MTNILNLMPFPRRPLTDRLLDLSDLGAQLRGNQPSDIRQLLTIAWNKISSPQGTDFDAYFSKTNQFTGFSSSLSIIAQSLYDRREDVVRCGDSRRFGCGDSWLCPRCARMRLRRKLLNRIGSRFAAEGEVFYLVVSLGSGTAEQRADFSDGSQTIYPGPGPRMAECTPEAYGIEFATKEDLRRCRVYWRIIQQAVGRMTKGSCIFGAVGGPELAVQFRPLRVLPHHNFLVWGYPTEGDAIELRNEIDALIHNRRDLRAGPRASVHLRRVPTSEDFGQVISYITKPIGVGEAYIKAAERIERDRDQMVLLNQDVNGFLGYLHGAIRGVRRMESWGICRTWGRNITPGRDRRAGTPMPERRKTRRSANAIQAMGAGAKKKLDEVSLKPRSLRYDFWHAQQPFIQGPTYPPRLAAQSAGPGSSSADPAQNTV